MLQRAYTVFGDVLTLAAQLASAQELPAPDLLRERISALFETTSQKAKNVGFSDLDVRESIYAVSAFMDEQILGSSWSGRQIWMSQPLQLIYFSETTAGEGFFHRLEALRASPGREHVVAVYFLCMALGFLGKYAVGSGGSAELQAVEAHTAAALGRRLPPPDNVSPHGQLRDTFGGEHGGSVPVVTIALGGLVAAILACVVLAISIGWQGDNASEKIQGVLTRASPALPALAVDSNSSNRG